MHGRVSLNPLSTWLYLLIRALPSGVKVEVIGIGFNKVE